jgi:general stress protein 26
MPKNGGADPERRKLRKLLKGFRVAMLTTVAQSGTLRSRPMTTARAQDDGDVWFLTKAAAPKVGEVEENGRVNVAYASEEDGRYVSISGTATVVRDRQRVQDVWRKRHRKWFPEGKTDPELALLRVRIDRAEYWDEPSGQMVALAAAPVPAEQPSDESGAAARAAEAGTAARMADAVKALVTGNEEHAEEKPPTPGGAQG